MAPATLAQYDAQNVTLLSQIPLNGFPSNPGNGNDCWGYVSPSGREYALMGLANALAVVDVTVPTSPVIIGSIPHSNSLWADVKVYGHYCYVSNESGGGLDVVDLGDVDNGNVTLVRRVTDNNLSTIHNLALNPASGYLYLCGENFNGGGLAAYSLADPSYPVRVGMAPAVYTHDANVVTYDSGPYAGKEIAFAFNGYSHFAIYDVTNKSNIITLSTTVYPGLNYCHQGWTTPDRQYCFLDDELDELNGYTPVTLTRVFNVSNLSAPTLETTFTTGLPAIDHNLYEHDGYVFEANYCSGLHIFDVSDPLHPVQTGYFDTYPGSDAPSFDGSWSNYPYFPSGNVIISDIDRGLFVVDVSAALVNLTFDLPDGIPMALDPNGGTTMRVVVSSRGGNDPEPGTGMLHYDDGNGTIIIPMNQVDTNVYDAVFPLLECGTTCKFFISAETTTQHTVNYPSGDINNALSAPVESGRNILLSDNFETDMGWTIQNDQSLTTGAWVRGIPSGGGGTGDPTADYDGSGKCFITGNTPNEDVDGGPTTLISPTFNLAGVDLAYVKFARWISNDDQDGDNLKIDVSNDNGGTWVSLASIAHDPRWVLDSYRLDSYISFTNRMKIRFSVSDNPNNSVTEAAIDAFEVDQVLCDPGNYGLDVTGNCPGTVSINWSGAAPHVQQGLVFARGSGSQVIPLGNPCAGTQLGLNADHLQLVTPPGFFNAGNGSGTINGQAPAFACGGYLQLVESGTCRTSNIVQLP